MTREEIMNSTPEQLARKYTEEQILSELDEYIPDDFGDFIGNGSCSDFSGEIIDQDMIRGCEQTLVEWFDENGEERPISAEDLAIAYQLWAASCFAQAYERNEDAVILCDSFVSMKAATALMDDEIREALHAEGITDPQEFIYRYCTLHYEKYGKEFTV